MRLRGTVRAPGHDGPVVASARLIIEEPPSTNASGRNHGFMLELDDGRTVSVSTFGAEVVPERRAAGRYEELQADPLVRLFEVVPGPVVRCRLAGAAIHDGDRVEVLGEPTAHDFAPDTGDFRTAPRQDVTALAAQLIGCGDDPAGAIDESLAQDEREAAERAAAPAREAKREERSQARRSLLRAAWGRAHLVPFGLALLIAATLPGSSARVVVASCAMALWLLGAGMMWTFFRSSYPRRAVADADDSLPGDVYVSVSLGVFFALMIYPAMVTSSLNYAHLITAFLSLSLLGMAVTVLRRTRGIVGTLRAIASAPPRTPDTPDGTWCSIAGLSEGMRISGVTVVRDDAIVHAARARAIDPSVLAAVAAGRVTGDLMRATGPASLLLFLCRDPAPRGHLARLVRLRRLTVLVAIGGAIAIIAIFIALYGRLPAFDTPDAT